MRCTESRVREKLLGKAQEARKKFFHRKLLYLQEALGFAVTSWIRRKLLDLQKSIGSQKSLGSQEVHRFTEFLVSPDSQESLGFMLMSSLEVLGFAGSSRIQCSLEARGFAGIY